MLMQTDAGMSDADADDDDDVAVATAMYTRFKFLDSRDDNKLVPWGAAGRDRKAASADLADHLIVWGRGGGGKRSTTVDPRLYLIRIRE